LLLENPIFTTETTEVVLSSVPSVVFVVSVVQDLEPS